MEKVIEPLTYILNKSLDTGIIPDDLKIAKVIPIYKSSDPSLLKNYRPISLLPAFSKLLEKIMYDKLMSSRKTFSINTNMVFGQNIQPSIPLYIFVITVPKQTTKQILNIHWQYFVIFPKLLTLLIIQFFWISLIIMELEVLQTTGSKII